MYPLPLIRRDKPYAYECPFDIPLLFRLVISKIIYEMTNNELFKDNISFGSLVNEIIAINFTAKEKLCQILPLI